MPSAYATPAAQPAVKQYPGYYYDPRTRRYYPLPKATPAPRPSAAAAQSTPTPAPTPRGPAPHISVQPFGDMNFSLALRGGYSLPWVSRQ